MYDFTEYFSLLSDLLRPGVLIPWLLAMVFGIFVGATPGLTATMAVALIVPFSFHLDRNAGLALIIGVSFTAIFAGDIPATYLRIPGTPASAAATLDSHALAQQGKGSLALYVDLFCSCIGGLVGVVLLMLVAPQLAEFALRFSSAEYFWLAILGLSVSVIVSQGSVFKGIFAAVLGLLLSTIGEDPLLPTERFTFGLDEFAVELHVIVVMIGLFGMSEVFRNIKTAAEGKVKELKISSGDGVFAALTIIFQYGFIVIPSSLIGVFIGALPGAGADIAAWAAYGAANKLSPKKERFGRGAIEGVIAPTSANNAAVAGAWIPALVFGVPGDAVTAIVLGALMIYGIRPGPLLFEQSGDQVQSIFLIALLTQFLLLPAGYLGIRAFGALMRLPRSIVMTAVVLFSLVGAYSLRNSVFDVGVMLAFGVLGYFLESRRVPLAPLILGLILGRLIEENFRKGLITYGDWTPFFTRPLSAAIWITLLLAFLIGPITRWLRKLRS